MSCTLSIVDGRLTAHPPTGESIAVRLVRATPRPAPQGAVSALDQKKREVWWWASLDELDPASRALADAELAERYHEPEILRITRVEPLFGGWHWAVETSAGPRRFVLRNPDRTLDQQADGRLLLRDVLGNRYVINAPERLDPHSLQELARIR